MPKAQPPEKRFWAKVRKQGGQACWLWTASVNAQGYGLFNRATKPSKCVLAHRFAYEICVGKPPGDICVLHRCDNPRCVRPDHLFLGTRTDNAADKVAKGRQRGPKGEANSNSKLTAAEVLAIRADWATGKYSKSEIARRHKIPLRTARAIIIRENWKHLTPENSHAS